MKLAEVKLFRTKTVGFRWIMKIESGMSISKLCELE